MAQIEHVRSFNGTSDEIELNAGDFSSTTPTATTMAAIVKRDGGLSFRWVWSVEGLGTGGTEFALGMATSTTLTFWGTPGGSGAISTAADYWTSAMGWVLVAITKADSASAPRFHRYRYDTQAWDHTDAGSSGPDFGVIDASAKMWLGTYDGASEFFDGDIACVGVWRDTALSDGNLETLTDAITDWEALSPTGLWLLNQTDTGDPVADRMGVGDQIGINGTSVVAESGLAFDVGDSVVASTGLRVVRSNQRW